MFCPPKKKTTYQIMSFLTCILWSLYITQVKRLNISISAKYVDGKGVNCSKMEYFVHELFWRAIIRFSNLILCSLKGT